VARAQLLPGPARFLTYCGLARSGCTNLSTAAAHRKYNPKHKFTASVPLFAWLAPVSPGHVHACASDGVWKRSGERVRSHWPREYRLNHNLIRAFLLLAGLSLLPVSLVRAQESDSQHSAAKADVQPQPVVQGTASPNLPSPKLASPASDPSPTADASPVTDAPSTTDSSPDSPLPAPATHSPNSGDFTLSHPNERYFVQHLIQDQKDIWTSPSRLQAGDFKWLVPMSGITAGLFVSDPSSSWGLASYHASAYNTASNAGLAAAVGLSGSAYLWGRITHNEHLRDFPASSG